VDNQVGALHNTQNESLKVVNVAKKKETKLDRYAPNCIKIVSNGNMWDESFSGVVHQWRRQAGPRPAFG
jgi:hypothetical protein